MKNLLRICLFFCFVFLVAPTFSTADDLGSVLVNRKVPDRLLNRFGTEAAKKHPEYGVLPFNAPCTDCIELLEKRTPNSREFISAPEGSGYRETYMQRSYGEINYMDENGFLRTKDPRLLKEGNSIYAARHQPFPVVVNTEDKWASITNLGNELRFNKEISLVWVNEKGETRSMGSGDWSRVSKTEYYSETTLLFADFYPGIDLKMMGSFGRIKTSFVIHARPVAPAGFEVGWLAMSQQFDLPSGMTADISASTDAGGGRRLGALNIMGADKQKYFDFTRSIAFDARNNAENFFEMPYTLENNLLKYYTPVAWLNDQRTQYPVTIDPLVNSTATLPQAAILGSGFTAVCGTLGCSYFLNGVLTPPNCEITKIECYFSYLANLPCIRDDGGFDITMTSPTGSCTSRNFTCLGGVQGACFFWPAQLMTPAIPPLDPCLLPPQCAPYPLDFEMKFRRCNWVPVVLCDASCILANDDWIISIVGRTVELTNVTLPQTICEGQCTNLAATADWGVPLVVGTNNYTFTWLGGTLVGDVINVCPTTTTHYDVTVTDLCGLTDTGSTDVTVVPFQNPGFTINPNDTVCTNTPMTFSAGGASPASSYDWIISCPVASGFNDTQNLAWTAPGSTGSCTATLNYEVVSGTLHCNFSQTQTFVVEPGSPPSVTIAPPGTLCPGQAITFTANGTNWGSAPTFQWSQNGSIVAGATNSTWNTNSLAAQFTVSVFVTSNSPCANPDTVSTTIVVPVSNAVVPSVLVTVFPDTICPGQQVTFYATPTNGGAAPTYQWQLNSVNIPGATNDSLVANPANSGDVYTVLMVSNSPCVAPPNAQDDESVFISGVIIPAVSVTADQPNQVCAGTQITFTANPVNQGPSPTFQWQLNNVNIAGATNITYTTTPPGTGTYGVIITSSLACANPNTANDTILITVVPAVTPGVSITSSLDTVCAGEPILFTAHPVNGGGSPTYQWTVDGNLAGGNYDTLTVYAPATSYIVGVQIISNAPCASPATATNTYNINVRPTVVPSVDVTVSDDTVCAGTPVNFAAVPAGGGTAPTYQWLLNNNPIAGATNPTYNATPGASTDVYSVTMTSNAVCVSPPTATDNAGVVVLSNAPPGVTVASDVGQIVCEGTPMTFTATPSGAGPNPGFQWLLNGNPIPAATNATYSPTGVLTGDIFECVITTSLACAVPTTDNDTLQMTILPIIPTNVGLTSTDDTICDGSPVTFTANPTGGGTDPVYAWTINGNAVGGNDTSFLSSTTMTNGAIVGVTMTSDLPCSSPATTTYTIFVTPNPVPSITQSSSPPSVCVGDVLTFTANGLNGGTAPVYQWYVNNVAVAGANGTTYSDVLNDGDIVTVEMTSNAPCANPVQATSNQIVAVVIPYVTPSISIVSSMVNDSICLGQNVTFDATGNNGGPSPIYSWYVNGVDQNVNGVSFSSSTLVQGDQITAMLVSSEQCLTQPDANSNMILVNVYPPLNLLAAGAATICPYEPVTLNASPGGGDGGPYMFDWTHDAGTTATVIVTPGITTLYTVTVTDNCGSSPVSDSVLVTVNPSPEANLNYRPLEPSTLAPEVNFHDLSLNPITWAWNFGDGDTSTIPDPVHSYAHPGEYDVTLVVTNIYGCIDSITYKVIVKEDISLFIPNCFTPNSDGRNEFFTPMGSSLEDFDFWIFDRWGEEVWHGNESSPWLGLSQRTGKPAPEDVYVYKVDLKYSKFGKRYVTGRVSLIY